MSTRELDAQQAAVWGAFLLLGMQEEEMRLPKGVTLLDYWESGQLELVGATTRHLITLWQEISAMKEWEQDHPGVFEYEVVSALGGYLAEHLVKHHAFPRDEDVHAAIRHLALTFFSQT